MAHPNARTEVRSIEELRERRSRNAGDIDRTYSLKMAIPEKIQQEFGNDFDFRWFNDVGMRIHQATEVDTWQKVPGISSLTVGTDEDRNPIKAYLCMKPKEFVREDRERKERGLVDVEKGIVVGSTEESDLASTSYVPKGQNRIGRITAPTT